MQHRPGNNIHHYNIAFSVVHVQVGFKSFLFIIMLEPNKVVFSAVTFRYQELCLRTF